MMGTVSEMMKGKGRDVLAIGPEVYAFEALKMMADKDIGALLVIEDGKPVGIFSERDYARKVILKGKSSKNTPVGELMTREVISVGPNNTLNECMAMMAEKHTRYLTVTDKGMLRGVISTGDVVKEIIERQNFTISELEKYILT